MAASANDASWNLQRATLNSVPVVYGADSQGDNLTVKPYVIIVGLDAQSLSITRDTPTIPNGASHRGGWSYGHG